MSDETEVDDEDVAYRITPLGLLSVTLGEHEARNVIDILELHMRRNYSSNGCVPAMVLDGKHLVFTVVQGVLEDERQT